MGQPRMFKTPDELETAINDYFKQCDRGRDKLVVDKRGNPVVGEGGKVMTCKTPDPYTMEGLALTLDCDGATLRKYAKRDGYGTIITRARRKIYDSWVRRGITGEYNPKIVALCLSAHNKEYRVNQQHEVTVQTIEDRLREIRAGRKQITDGIPDAELIE